MAAEALLLMLGTGRLYAPSLRGRKAIMLPAGALVYVALALNRNAALLTLDSEVRSKVAASFPHVSLVAPAT